MKCPNCDSDMIVQPFGGKGARSCKCSNPKCRVYFVLPKGAISPKEATHVPPPKPEQPENPAAPLSELPPPDRGPTASGDGAGGSRGGGDWFKGLFPKF
jgi:hypothetical protein